MLIGGALVNALAFSGTNYLFSTLRKRGVDEERKRHDKAVEKLQAAQEAWSRQRTKRLDWIAQELQRKGHAVKTFRDVETAMREYSRVFGEAKSRSLEGLGPEPRLSDFYVPSASQKDRELAFIVLGMAATGVIAYEISKR